MGGILCVVYPHFYQLGNAVRSTNLAVYTLPVKRHLFPVTGEFLKVAESDIFSWYLSVTRGEVWGGENTTQCFKGRTKVGGGISSFCFKKRLALTAKRTRTTQENTWIVVTESKKRVSEGSEQQTIQTIPCQHFRRFGRDFP